MCRVDRGNYVPKHAYVDTPQYIGYDATISAPHMHGACLELLADHMTPGKRVLDVGVGSGYLAACMALLVGETGKVVGIDVVPELVDLAEKNLNADNKLELEQLTIRIGDGWAGSPDDGPFDAIHVGAAAAETPKSLLEQLANGGRMVIPVGPEGENQLLIQYDKDDDGKITEKILMGVRYVPLVRGQEEQEE
eukprot:TRINITY_DN10095_c0_g1_i1.p1 TRINITY_DN10095_c0_g1~~TRINITY_DN10095_c0_g1_i1.p1  ORF type:complete len:225 (+),score=33.22 TRINITY_DN10095_c0_g1_i1:97-675(+)